MVYKHIPTEVREAYLDWLMTPPGQRDPDTKKGFAEAHDISENTLQYWEKSDEFQQRILSLKTEWGAKYYPDILGRLIKIVQDGSDNAAVQASKVLLGHLKIQTEDEKTPEMESAKIEAIRKALEDQGYKLV